ncbi:DEAD/DEAH box helicase [Allostreptomyces psammosilenae]|uniref:Superfamily II DNA or RNA helicase n=1 Tax=Allostreptomyces psammosilenae TaxID=1892865 RepID=A0A852ZSS1_9ACTN|nr:DEAD/DEAH box helicase [Allostreptomyces psammosilenae]NYI05476.1 superfamily II DNA or RNA helicase [Allostreptomyces psammosilenae]
MTRISEAQAAALLRCAAVFEAGDPPRGGHIAFWAPDGSDLPGDVGEPGDLPVVLPAPNAGDVSNAGNISIAGDAPGGVDAAGTGDGEDAAEAAGGVVERVVPAVRLTVAEAVPVLSRARRAPAAHPACAFWGAAVVVALQLVARGRMLPGVTPEGYDAWRVGPLDAADVERIRTLAAAMPPEARAVPLPASATPAPAGRQLLLPEAEPLLRGFLDAVADGMPRTPAAARATGAPAFAAPAPRRVPELRGWAQEISAGVDSGVRISLRLEMVGGLATDRDGAFRAVVQVHSLADPTLVADAADLWGAPGRHFGERARIDAMLAVRRAARAWSALEPLLHSAVPDAVELADEDVRALLGAATARLAAAGVDVHWPKDLVTELTARAVVGAGTEAPPSDLPSFFGGGRALRLDWQLALGGEPLTPAEMDRLAEAHRPVVRLRDQWVLVDPELARKARERELKPLTAIDALGAALTGTAEVDGERVEVAAGGWLDALRRRIAQPDGHGDGDRGGDGVGASADGAEPLRQPEGLAATLRDYQVRGLRWLDRMTSLGLGGCLADDMGLGKTITLIALHLHRQAPTADGTAPGTAGPTLVVCPASLLGNWEREIRRFAPGTPVRRFHAGARSLDGLAAAPDAAAPDAAAPDASAEDGEAASGGFVLTTYGTMRLDVDRLATVDWGLVVADEAQHVKNPRSATARALRRLPARARVALTGTPVENNLSELWAILDWTTPGLLGTLSAFRTRWAGPIEAAGRVTPTGGGRAATGTAPNQAAGSATATAAGTATAERFARLIRPFLLRRRKSDPGIAPELPPKTETDRPVALTREQAGLYEAVVREIMAEIEASSGMERRGQIVRLLTALKQICNHPAQYLAEGRDARLAGRSGKLELLDELVGTILAEDGAVLVFTQYVAMARLIERHLAERGVPTQLLHGGTPVARRDAMVRRFQDGEVPVFLLSLKAAGTGLNLTRADHVVHYDRWWNPAVEDQATDRAYRIGQTRPVQVHRLIAEGTIEDRVAAMLRAKRELADAVLSSGEAALTELSDAELAELVELRSGR